MLPRRYLTRLLATAAGAALALGVTARAEVSGPGRAYFYTEPGYQGEVFALDGGVQLENLALIRDAQDHPFNHRIRSVQLEGPVRLLMYEHADFRGATMWVNGDVPDLGAFSIGYASRGSWSRNISSVRVQTVAGNVVVFARWNRREAERVVQAAFRDILSRPADAAGLRHYLGRLIDAGWNEQQLRDDLRHSDEFRHRDVDALIRRAYRDVLGRDPDAAGLAAYQRSLGRGMTDAKMRDDLRRSRGGGESHSRARKAEGPPADGGRPRGRQPARRPSMHPSARAMACLRVCS